MKSPPKNVVCHVVRYCLLSSVSILMPLVVLQEYLISLGASNGQLGILSAIGSCCNAIGIFAFSAVIDRVSKFSVFRVCAAVSLSGSLLQSLWLLCSTGFSLRIHQSYGLFCIATSIQAVFTGVSSLFETSLLVRLSGNFPIVKVSGLAGMAAGLTSIACGFFVKSQLNHQPPEYQTLAFAAAAAVIAALLATFLLRGNQLEAVGGCAARLPIKAFQQAFQTRAFRRIAIPNLLRSVQYSVVFFVPAIGVRLFADEPGFSGFVSIALAASGLTSCLLLLVLQKKIRLGAFYRIGACISAISLLAFLITRSFPLFLIFLYFLYCGQSLIDNIFPLVVYQIAPLESIGSITAARILLYMVGNAIFSFLAGKLLDTLPVSVLLLSGAAALILGGEMMFRVDRRQKAMGS